MTENSFIVQSQLINSQIYIKTIKASKSRKACSTPGPQDYKTFFMLSSA